MKRNLLVLALSSSILTIVLISSCTKDEGKLPVQTTPPPTASACDTVTYTKHIKPIIETNCALSGCHASPTSNPFLENYTQVKEKAERVKARAVDANPSIMPPSPNTPLTAAQKDLINCWVSNGMKE